MGKVCLVVIYNHKFEKNIPVIRRIYAGRFSAVYQVMPFYRGSEPDVIGVYEGSYQFNGYIAQAAPRFVRKEYTHYVFVADDMVLNPCLNEDNIIEQLELDQDEGLITDLSILTSKKLFDWPHGLSGMLRLNGTGNDCEWRNVMPSLAEARAKFEKMGLNWRECTSRKFIRWLCKGLKPMYAHPWHFILRRPFGLLRHFSGFCDRHNKTFAISSNKIVYPTVAGYSDFFVVPAAAMSNFCHYCGVFAAARQFVEMAIPTALVLACDKVQRLADSKWKFETGVYDYAMRQKLEEESGCSYRRLMEKYPEDYLFIHPIKLSHWSELP